MQLLPSTMSSLGPQGCAGPKLMKGCRPTGSKLPYRLMHRATKHADPIPGTDHAGKHTLSPLLHVSFLTHVMPGTWPSQHMACADSFAISGWGVHDMRPTPLSCTNMHLCRMGNTNAAGSTILTIVQHILMCSRWVDEDVYRYSCLGANHLLG